MTTDRLSLGNGRVRVTRIHTSKRGRTYKRRHVEADAVKAPSWLRGAMERLRWFR